MRLPLTVLIDLYGSHDKYLETFVKTQINNHGNDEHGGLIFEWDPARHRRVSKQLSPAFSGRALKAKESILHEYIDLFVHRMTHFGTKQESVNLTDWINWACVDISADMAYNRKMKALEDMKYPSYLSLLSDFNVAVVIIQLCWRFPLLTPLKYLFLFLTSSKSHAAIRKHSRFQLEQRIKRQGAVEHLDFFAHIVPEDRELPKDRRDMRHLEQVAGQLLLASYEAPSLWLYFTFYHLLQSPGVLDTLKHEIRGAFKSYGDITPAAAASLPYLTACLKESLRLVPTLITGQPVVSPGASVDGVFIPSGVVCQSSPFSLARSPRYFRKPLQFRPERWLPHDDPRYNEEFKGDNLLSFQPFSQGPRMCTGREIAWWHSRLFVSKVLWAFDLELISKGLNIDRDLKGWSMYVKPELLVRFSPVSRQD
jgi:cytochrome P450